MFPCRDQDQEQLPRPCSWMVALQRDSTHGCRGHRFPPQPRTTLPAIQVLAPSFPCPQVACQVQESTQSISPCVLRTQR